MFKGLRVVMLLGGIAVSAVAGVHLLSTANAAKAASNSTASTAAPETTTVDRGDVAIAVTATGTIQAVQNIPLAFSTSGVVTGINVKAGDRVLKGQTLATVDDQSAQDAVSSAQVKVQAQQTVLNDLLLPPRQVDIDVMQAAINLAQAQLKESQVGPADTGSLQTAQNNVDIAKNQLWQAQLNRDINNQKKDDLLANPRTAGSAASLPSDTQNNRPINSAQYAVSIAQDQVNALLSQGANPGSIASAQAALTTAQAQLQILMNGPNTDDVKQAKDTLASAQAALTQAQQNLDKTKLIAPFDGLIAQVNLSLGQQAPAAQAIVFLDVSSFYVDLPIAELDIASVKVGQNVNLRFDALPTTPIQGKVIQVASVANTGTPVTYTVRVQVDPAGQPLYTTMSATASIITSNAANVIRLPNRFIRIDRTKNKAYASVRQPDGTFKDVAIQLGTANDTYTQIVSGLNEGDVVGLPQTAGSSGGNGGFPRPGGGAAGGVFRGAGG
jgi:RND family efflux transporter MFP subunit